MDTFAPSSPQNFTFRPLNKGMQTSSTSVSMPDGSFLSVKGFDVLPKGLQRRGGWVPTLYDSGSGLSEAIDFLLPLEEHVEDLAQFALDTGERRTIAVTNRFLYVIDRDSGYTPVPWQREYVVDSIVEAGSTTTIVVSGDYRTDYLEDGDYVRFGGELLEATTVTASATELTLELDGTFTTPPVATDEFNIYKAFKAVSERIVDFTFGRGRMYLVDGSSMLVFQYDGAFLQPLIIVDDTSTRVVMGARTITYFADRLFFGDIIEYDSSVSQYYFGQRVRWTEVLDLTTCLQANYQDLVRTRGKIIKLFGMGNLLMCYTNDGVYYGRETNLTTLPYAFTLIESGGVTIVGPKAVCSYFDGQVFIGQDNAYYIGSDASITPIATLIAEDLVNANVSPQVARAMFDANLGRLILSESERNELITKMFFFNSKSKGWSFVDCSISCPSLVKLADELYYYELGAVDTYETTWVRNNTYISLMFFDAAKQLLAFQDSGHLLEYTSMLDADQFVGALGTNETSAIPLEIVTPDFDFDDPDADKSALRLSLKVTDLPNVVRINVLRFKVEGSSDRGRTWRDLGTMEIDPDDDEDALNFRMTGSTLRFRLTSGEDVDQTGQLNPPFLLSEIVLRVRLRGQQAIRANPRPV